MHPSARSAAEAALTVAACAAIAVASTPLPSPSPQAPVGLTSPGLYVPGAFALWVGAAAFALLVALRIGRSHLPAPASVALIAAVWLAFWGIARDDHDLLWAALGALAIAPLAARLHAIRGRPWLPARDPGSAWVIPGLVLFCAAGALWLMDYAARGPARFRGDGMQMNYALRQATDVALLFTVVSLLTPLSAATLRAFMRVMSWFEQTPSKRKLLAAAACAWAGLLVATYRPSAAHIVGEMLRLPYLALFGWWCYRWVDASLSFRRLAMRTALAWCALAAACLLVRESGQLLVCTAVTAITLCGLRTHVSLVRGRLRAPLATALASSAIALLWAGVFVAGAALPHVAARILAVEQPFTASVDFLAINKWFIAEAGWWGFGLGQVPWCGYPASLAGACSGGQGLPQQLPMDYVFVALAGVWGLGGALGLTVAMILWLTATAAHARPGVPAAMSISHLRNWLVSIWCLAMLVQVFLTCMGSLGAFPLTGLPLPFLSVGRLGIFTSALVLAWAATETEAKL